MDDLKPTDDSTKEPVSESGVQPTGSQTDFPQPTPPEPAPTVPTAPPATKPEQPPEPPSQTVPTQTTVTTKEPPLIPTPAVTKPSGKKLPSAIKVGGALVFLLLAATLPATIILVQDRTSISPKAEEAIVTPQAKFPDTGGAYIILRKEEQQLEQAQPIKPHDLKIEAIAPGKTKITFNTLGSCSSSVRYSPDENWNYLTMIQEDDIGDEWRERYHYQNEKIAQSMGGDTATTSHEFILENLASGQKYYFAIEVKDPRDNNFYLFGLEQPENQYTFIAQ